MSWIRENFQIHEFKQKLAIAQVRRVTVLFLNEAGAFAVVVATC